ncbi:MAG: copper-binding protein [Verrucomicrobia bacterium]|nr:copper-binding protein [Verrucomicrobiota bacterium]
MVAVPLTLLLAAVVGHAEPSAPVASYPMRGVLRGIDAQTGQATIAHEPIRGYMPAMTMDFAAANPAELRGLQPGDTLTCWLCVAPDRAWIEGVRKELSTAATPLITPLQPANVNRTVELGPGDLVPDVELIDVRGATVRLHDFHGKALAIAFIYLRCPLPTYCPYLNRNFQAAQSLLVRLGCADQMQFLSVSMDPENDTPARLAEGARAYEADGQRWQFVAAREDALRQLGGSVGLEFQRGRDGWINHNLRTIVIDPQGRLRHVFRGNAWTPQELAAELRAAISGQP